MSIPLSIGTCAVFTTGFADFLVSVPYAVVAAPASGYWVLPLDSRNRTPSRFLKFLDIGKWRELEDLGIAHAEVPPILPMLAWTDAAIGAYDKRRRKEPKRTSLSVRNGRLAQLAPLYEQRARILESDDPVAMCNEVARHAGLNVTRVAQMFFHWAAYQFEPNALLPKSCVHPSVQAPKTKKRGPRVKDSTVTAVGWPFDHENWPTKIMAGWDSADKLGKTYMSVYLDTLRKRFDCEVELVDNLPMRIVAPKDGTYPSYSQWAHFVKKKIGVRAWKVTKRGEKTVYNHARVCASPPSSSKVTNVLQDCEWDGQEIDEPPADLRDPTKHGSKIIRVRVTCKGIHGPVGLGYDYLGESSWAYLMALLSMIMDKAIFCALFGFDLRPGEWLIKGAPLRILGDRGPAIATPVRELVAQVLKLAQVWAASHAPRGKPYAEGHNKKTTKVEGNERHRSTYRSAGSIIRDDIRDQVTEFMSGDRSKYLTLDQLQRKVPGTPAGLCADLMSHGLYAGRQYSFEQIARHTMVAQAVSITGDGTYLGGLRYLSPELEETGLLEQAVGNAIPGVAYFLRMAVKRIWLDHAGTLIPLEAVPVRFGAWETQHFLTLPESLVYAELMAGNRRAVEQQAMARQMDDAVNREKDERRDAEALRAVGIEPAPSRRATVNQLDQVFRKRRAS
jgi:hypothetical protein